MSNAELLSISWLIFTKVIDHQIIADKISMPRSPCEISSIMKLEFTNIPYLQNYRLLQVSTCLSNEISWVYLSFNDLLTSFIISLFGEWSPLKSSFLFYLKFN